MVDRGRWLIILRDVLTGLLVHIMIRYICHPVSIFYYNMLRIWSVCDLVEYSIRPLLQTDHTVGKGKILRFFVFKRAYT